MNFPRYIPILLLRDGGLCKTQCFKRSVYLGDPINIVRIFNDKQVDELVLLDIDATRLGTEPNLDLLRDIAGECFMPLSYGGGISKSEQVREILGIGFEKIIVNSAALQDKALVPELSEKFGRSSIVGSMDVKVNWRRKRSVYISGGTEDAGVDPITWAKELERMGVGELLVNSIDRDGQMQGFDKKLIMEIVHSVSIPVIAAGGASSQNDLAEVIEECGASAAAAGSIFVFQGKHKAVLISYPSLIDRIPNATN